MIIDKHSLSLETKTGQNKIKLTLYLPAGADDSPQKPRALVLIIHGMAEHQQRYRAFAEYLTTEQYAVCTFDLPGHGLTAPTEKHLGFFAETDGAVKVYYDLEEIISLLRNRFTKIPLVLLGHSMGSLISYYYSSRTNMQADILVLSGLPAPNKFAALAYQLARLSTKRNGPYHRDKFLDRLMNGKFLAKLPHAKTAFDWLCSDEQIVKDYIADPLCGFVFTAAGFRDLFFWLRRLTAAKWVKKIPKNLPIIIFAGERDPVGVYGLGVRKVDYRLRRSGHEVDLLIYPHGHHEMLNEVNKRDVWSDVTSRLNKFFPLDVPN